nr:MAG: chaperonin 10 Kd subunit [Bacteriophage sp.]
MVAELFNKTLPGLPTENRVLILSPKDINTTKTGIIIPGTVSEGVPRKGVVVKRGTITEEYKTYTDLTEVGRVVTYGMYAGKELEFEIRPDWPESVKNILEKNIVTVLSLNEIIYSEANNN